MKKIRLSSIFAFLMVILFANISCYNPDDVNYKVTIYYKVDNSVSKTLTFYIEKNTMLLGRPDTWGDKSWVWNPSTGDYGYSDASDNSAHYFAANEDGVYSFVSMFSDEEWDTSQIVSKNLIITPKYKDSVGDKLTYFKVDIIYYLTNQTTDSTTGIVTYGEPKKCKHTIEFEKNSQNKAKINVDNILKELSSLSVNKLTLDPELGYGYIDWTDHGKRKVFYPNSSLSYPQLIDDDGNIYVNSSEISEDKTLYFKYLDDAGYAPRSNSFKAMPAASGDTPASPIYFSFDTVYVPGNVDSDGVLHPWPYSVSVLDSNSDVTIVPYSISSQDKAVESNDYSVIRNLEVMDAFVCQDFIAKAIQDSSFNTKFLFFNDTDPLSNENSRNRRTAFDETDPNLGGLKEAGLGSIPWLGPNVFQCAVMANMLTYLYNKANTTQKGFEPLSYVYTKSDGTPYFDCRDTDYNTNATYNFNGIKINYDANGFRLMTDKEWEYCAKIITDERQLPDLDSDIVKSVANSFFYKKGDKTGYTHYFRSINDGEYDPLVNKNTTGLHYSGSGAGLALARKLVDYDGNTFLYYDKYNLRTGAMACGRDELNSPRDISSLIKGTDCNTMFDYNTRNGAGLYNMSGFATTPVSNFYSHYMINRGAPYSVSRDSNTYRFKLFQKTYLACSAYSIYLAPRFCRTVK